MTTFLLIRHASTDALGKRLAGRAPGVHLNETGKQQAQQLAERLAPVPIHALYSSPLERAVETATFLAQILHLELVTNDVFLEIDFGDWTGSELERLLPLPAFQRFNAFRSHARVPGGELMLEAQVRFVTGLERLSAQHPQETVAIVSHADMIKSALAYYLGMPLDLMQRLEISPSSISILNLYDDMPQILQINDTRHLDI